MLKPFEVRAILPELCDPFRTLLFAAVVIGPRRGELFRLKWEDVNFREAQIQVVRSLVDMKEGPPKTLASRQPIPLSTELAEALSGWKEQTGFHRGEDWVWASSATLGVKPYWPDAVLKRHRLPAADRAGVVKRIGWQSFRRTWQRSCCLPGRQNCPGVATPRLSADDLRHICKGGHRRKANCAGKRRSTARQN